MIVEVGYNDDPATFAQSVEEAITTLLGAGAKRILWVNMREKREQYIRMNKELRAVARQHPEVTIVDWDSYSRERYPWFQSDGIHLGYEGAVAMATLLHGEITDALAPPLVVVSTRLPAGGPAGRTWHDWSPEVGPRHTRGDQHPARYPGGSDFWRTAPSRARPVESRRCGSRSAQQTCSVTRTLSG